MSVKSQLIVVRGVSFLRYFGLVFLLFLAGVFCAALAITQSRLSFRWAAAGLLIAAGCVPLILQLRIGFALDRSWVARYGRSTEPARYWTSVLIGAVLAIFWGYIAISFARS
jgi:cytochrome c biogenesis protein CcdA